jgi:phosphoglycolate phosphatase-like HAD superfamily hydrolase
VVIGDTPRDIACARADDLRCVAVTTGPHGRAELAGADLVVDSTAELRDAIETLTEATSG